MKIGPLLILLVSGCSFASVRVPSARVPGKPLHCSDAAPIADTAISLAAVATVAVLVGRSVSSGGGPGAMNDAYEAIFIGPPSAAIGLTYLASAIYGHSAMSRCRRLRDEPLLGGR